MTTAVTRVVLTGISGRMGSVLARMVRQAPDLELTGATARAGSAAIGLDVGLAAHLGPFELTTRASLTEVLGKADVVIDFTNPESSIEHAQACAAAKVPLVVGTTGFSADQKRELAQIARTIGIVASPNMSIGVNLVIDIAAQLARRLGEEFDVEICETHHRNKKDAPSGTAVRMADELVKALGRSPDDVRYTRDGQIGVRPRKEIGVQSLRGGDVVGEHTIFFFGEGERVELTHRASSRDQFARGALRAARWVCAQPPGLYDMSHVLKVH
jgi:4-hydroxy-tetrahydrodipicolinate reductase